MATTFYKPLSCFEPSFERFATVSQDGRLKIFDTRSGGVQQQLAEKDHLSTQYTAIAWGATTFQGVGQTERSKRAKKQLGGAVAIGTAKGTIVVWDVLRGEVHKELGGKEGHTGKVNDLVFTEGATFLFSCSDDLQVIKWNIENGEIVAKFKADNQPISSLALSADNSTLATASAMIKMWDLASSKSQKKFTGHTSAVTSLNFSANGKFLVSASATERYTSVWDLEAAGNAGAAAVFTAASNPVYVEFSKPKKAKAKTSLVLALFRSGSVGLWQFDGKAEADAKPTSHKPDSVIKIVAGDEADSKRKKGKAGSVLFAQFTNEHEVLVAFGTTTKPIFERVSLLDEVTGQLKKKINIRDASEAGGALIEAEAPREKKPNVHSNLIGPTQVNSLVKAGVATETNKPEPAVAAKPKEVTKAAAAKPKQTLTLQEQLDRMQLTVTEEEEKEADDEEKMEAQLSGALEKEVRGLLSVWGGEDKKTHKLKAHQVAPKATSLASALSQAIHTKDRHLLEKVLNIGQEQIIFGTVTRLQQDHVLPFLQLVLFRFRNNPNRSVNLLVWIRAVLVEHVAYLSTVPALLTSLSDLYSTVRTRLANHKRYVKLAGRLELLNAQIQERNERAEQSQGGVCFYHEDDDKGPKGDDNDEDGVSLMDVMDMGDEDEQDAMDDEDDDDDDDDEDDEIEEDDDNENGDEPSGDEAGGEPDFDDDDEAASDDGEAAGEEDDDDEEEEDEDN